MSARLRRICAGPAGAAAGRILALLLMTVSARAAAVDTVADLQWLAGCWSSEGAEHGSAEHWMAPAGGTMLGMARTVRDGQTVAYEWLRIVETPNGSLRYLARPDGGAETRFELVERQGGAGQDEAVAFANPDHDFPQRIAYRRSGTRLEAEISGEVQGVGRTVAFPMERGDCPGR